MVKKTTTASTSVMSAGTSSKKTISEEQLEAMRVGRMKASKNGRLSTRLGLDLPPQQVHRFLRRGRYTKSVNRSCGVFMAAAMQWLMGEIIDSMVLDAERSHSKMLTPKHISGAIASDEELSQLLGSAVIVRGGVRLSYSESRGAMPTSKKSKPSAAKATDGDEDDEEEDEEVEENGPITGASDDDDEGDDDEDDGEDE